MKFIVKAQIPTEEGNKLVKNPNFVSEIESYISSVKAEASYFFESDGNRTFAFVVDMPSVDYLPAVAEPLFQKFSAKVQFHPVMVLSDLKKAIEKLGK